MTTRVIREALEELRTATEPSCAGHCTWRQKEAYDAALEAVAAIEKMARDVLGTSDDIDPAALEGVITDESVDLLERIAKEAP